jgi:hypothetical protein
MPSDIFDSIVGDFGIMVGTSLYEAAAKAYSTAPSRLREAMISSISGMPTARLDALDRALVATEQAPAFDTALRKRLESIGPIKLQ